MQAIRFFCFSLILILHTLNSSNLAHSAEINLRLLDEKEVEEEEVEDVEFFDPEPIDSWHLSDQINFVAASVKQIVPEAIVTGTVVVLGVTYLLVEINYDHPQKIPNELVHAFADIYKVGLIIAAAPTLKFLRQGLRKATGKLDQYLPDPFFIHILGGSTMLVSGVGHTIAATLKNADYWFRKVGVTGALALTTLATTSASFSLHYIPGVNQCMNYLRTGWFHELNAFAHAAFFVLHRHHNWHWMVLPAALILCDKVLERIFYTHKTKLIRAEFLGQNILLIFQNQKKYQSFSVGDFFYVDGMPFTVASVSDSEIIFIVSKNGPRTKTLAERISDPEDNTLFDKSFTFKGPYSTNFQGLERNQNLLTISGGSGQAPFCNLLSRENLEPGATLIVIHSEKHSQGFGQLIRAIEKVRQSGRNIFAFFFVTQAHEENAEQLMAEIFTVEEEGDRFVKIIFADPSSHESQILSPSDKDQTCQFFVIANRRFDPKPDLNAITACTGIDLQTFTIAVCGNKQLVNSVTNFSKQKKIHCLKSGVDF